MTEIRRETNPSGIARASRAGTGWMIAGSLIGAILAWLFQRIGVDRMGSVGFEPIGNAWTVMYVTATVLLIPLEQYATREVSRGLDPLRDEKKVVTVIASIAVAVGLAAGWFGRDLWFQGSAAFSWILAMLLAAFAWYALAKGIFAGRRNFREVGILLIAEGAIRIVALYLLLLITLNADVVGWSLAVAPMAAFVLLGWLGKPQTKSGAPPAPAVPFFGAYVLGSGASQMLLASAPLVVKILGGEAAAATIVFITFTFFRAPMTLILSLQSRLLSSLVRRYEAGEHELLWKAATRLSAVGPVLVMAGWAAGWLLGPWIVRLAYSADVEPSSGLAAWAAAGILAASTAQILGQLLVARAATGRLAAAWMIGLTVALVVVMLSSGSAEHRVAIAFGVGEIAAMVAASTIVLTTFRNSPARP